MQVRRRGVCRSGLMVLFLTLPGCGGSSGPAGPTSAVSTSASAAPTTSVVPTTVTATTAPASTAATTTPVTATVPVTAPTTTSLAPPTSVPRLVDVKVYLLREDRLVIAHRQVMPPAVLRGALSALLEGPTADERQATLATAVPEGTSLLDVALADGLATVDLSPTFAAGGGTLSMQARIAQVVFTATQFANVDRVLFRLGGRPVDALGGEGLVLTEPQLRMNSPRTLTGAVLVDTPAPGAPVARTFTVTGEGDVFEGEFPVEVWAGDRLVGGAHGVRAGAWGTWATFSVTLTVDAPPGPIRLVAYDAGGCGDDPSCPPITKTVVPLILVS